MKRVKCNHCEKNMVPLNDTIKIDGSIYCIDCVNSKFPDGRSLQEYVVERDIDPTVCAFCSKDFDDVDLKKLSEHPVCDDCEIDIKRKTFPLWVKGFFISILLIVVFSFCWNWRYYQAFNNIRKSNDYAVVQDYTNAANFMNLASEEVPEVQDVKILAHYYSGLDLLVKDKSKDALKEFSQCKDFLPLDYNIETLMIQARIGASFDDKDYQGFLVASKENLAIDSTVAISWASVASAYACIYAKKGDAATKVMANNAIQKAKLIDSTSQEMKEYYNMIDYRIATRNIIERKEFVKKYPNGWTKN